MSNIRIPMIPSHSTFMPAGGYVCADGGTFVARKRTAATEQVLEQLPGTQVWSPPT